MAVVRRRPTQLRLGCRHGPVAGLTVIDRNVGSTQRALLTSEPSSRARAHPFAQGAGQIGLVFLGNNPMVVTSITLTNSEHHDPNHTSMVNQASTEPSQHTPDRPRILSPRPLVAMGKNPALFFLAVAFKGPTPLKSWTPNKPRISLG